MSQLTMVIDLNRCVGCLSCNSACKTVNEVPIGLFRNTIHRVGPTPKFEGAVFPDIEWYYLPMQCQHCENPDCVNACPTGASFKAEDGTVRVDAAACIGCELCVGACPYGVRFLNPELNVVEKCTLCEQNRAEGVLPQCVKECVGLAKWFGDIDEDPTMLSFRGGYESTLGETVRDFTEDDVYTLPGTDNGPSFRYILRGKSWQGFEAQ